MSCSGRGLRPAWVPLFFFFQAEDGIRDKLVTGVQTCALPICTSGSVQRKRALRPIDSDLPVHTLCQEVVSWCHRDSEAGPAFGAAYAPAAEPPGLIGRQRAVAQPNDRLGREVRAEGRLMSQAGREGEGRKVDHRVRGPRGHVETMHEVELHHAAVGHPGAAEVRGPVQERLRPQRRCSRERKQHERNTRHDEPPCMGTTFPFNSALRIPHSALDSPPVANPLVVQNRNDASLLQHLDARRVAVSRSEEHTSELQSLAYLVCRLLLEKKKKI